MTKEKTKGAPSVTKGVRENIYQAYIYVCLFVSIVLVVTVAVSVNS